MSSIEFPTSFQTIYSINYAKLKPFVSANFLLTIINESHIIKLKLHWFHACLYLLFTTRLALILVTWWYWISGEVDFHPVLELSKLNKVLEDWIKINSVQWIFIWDVISNPVFKSENLDWTKISSPRSLHLGLEILIQCSFSDLKIEILLLLVLYLTPATRAS